MAQKLGEQFSREKIVFLANSSDTTGYQHAKE